MIRTAYFFPSCIETRRVHTRTEFRVACAVWGITGLGAVGLTLWVVLTNASAAAGLLAVCLWMVAIAAGFWRERAR